MESDLPLIVEDVQFDTLPAGSTSVKLLPVIAVTVFFVGILILNGE